MTKREDTFDSSVWCFFPRVKTYYHYVCCYTCDSTEEDAHHRVTLNYFIRSFNIENSNGQGVLNIFLCLYFCLRRKKEKFNDELEEVQRENEFIKLIIYR